VIAQGSMPRDAICIGFVAEGCEVTRYNTSVIGEEEIQVYPQGVELLYHAVAASRWVNFIVPEERLQRAAMTRMRRPLKLPRAVSSVRLQPGGRLFLTRVADDALALARTMDAAGGISPDLANELSRSLLAGYVDALSDANITRKSDKSPTAERHHHLILACERFVTSGEDAGIALVDIAQRSGYSLRSLELIFRRSVGMTPGRWFLNVRLNGALRDLLIPGPTCSVSEVASRWGFLHLSRFSEQYRKAFGELPSQTLNRSRSLS
jgi:AraC family transcriptional regulator, ethanolamine operon transcriptional activator